MSDEYNESPAVEYAPETRSGFPMDAFIPLVLLALTFIVLLGWQVSVSSTQHGLIETTIKNQEAAVTQAQQVQAGVKKLASDLMEAAQTDDTAKAIAGKYIRANGSPAPAATTGGTGGL